MQFFLPKPLSHWRKNQNSRGVSIETDCRGRLELDTIISDNFQNKISSGRKAFYKQFFLKPFGKISVCNCVYKIVNSAKNTFVKKIKIYPHPLFGSKKIKKKSPTLIILVD